MSRANELGIIISQYIGEIVNATPQSDEIDEMERRALGGLAELETIAANAQRLEADYDRLLTDARRVEDEARRANERIQELAVLFNVPDGGYYLNDWRERAARYHDAIEANA